MNEKYNPKYEAQIAELAVNRIKTRTYKTFDFDARIITRESLPELVARGKTEDDRCLIIVNREGETIAITREFETMLYNALKNRD